MYSTTTTRGLNSAIAAQTLDANLNPTPVNSAIPSPHTTLYANPRLDLRTGANGTLTLRYIYNNDHQANGGIGQLALASQAFANTTVTQTLQVVKDMLTKFTQDKMSTSIPLFFPKNPPGSPPAGAVLEQDQGHPLARADLNGSPRIALADPPRSNRRA